MIESLARAFVAPLWWRRRPESSSRLEWDTPLSRSPFRRHYPDSVRAHVQTGGGRPTTHSKRLKAGRKRSRVRS